MREEREERKRKEKRRRDYTQVTLFYIFKCMIIGSNIIIFLSLNIV